MSTTLINKHGRKVTVRDERVEGLLKAGYKHLEKAKSDDTPKTKGDTAINEAIASGDFNQMKSLLSSLDDRTTSGLKKEDIQKRLEEIRDAE